MNEINTRNYMAEHNTGSKYYSICHNVLTYAQKVVITVVLQHRMLKEFHERYPRIARIKVITRSYIYWPSMDKNIEKLVKACRDALWQLRYF